ncbi:MAG: hypothetical protein KA536_21685 [Saprospiraceae bacterium]|nr:hypothetical protein [Saprospiraceae bacterium]
MDQNSLINKLENYLSECDDQVTYIKINQENFNNYIDMAIYLSSIKVRPKKRLAPVQVKIMAELVKETIKNGPIINNRIRFSAFVKSLVTKEIIKSQNSFSTHKGMLIEQGWIIQNTLHSSLEADPRVIETIRTKRMVIALTCEKVK